MFTFLCIGLKQLSIYIYTCSFKPNFERDGGVQVKTKYFINIIKRFRTRGAVLSFLEPKGRQDALALAKHRTTGQLAQRDGQRVCSPFQLLTSLLQ